MLNVTHMVGVLFVAAENRLSFGLRSTVFPMDKVALVTGGNRGIGYAIVKRLSREYNGVVLFTARDVNNGTKVCGELSKELNATNIQFHPLDITSKESIDKLRDHVLDTFGGLDVLINNSGVLLKRSIPYVERAEITIKTNYFGTLDMCNSFFPLLRPHARVVNLSSQMGDLRNVSPSLREQFASPTLTIPKLTALMEKYLSDSKDGKVTENGWPDDSVYSPAYRVSKIGVTLLSMAQARQFQHDQREGIIVNAVCPGWVQTDMGGPSAHRTPDEGADTPVYCVLLPEGTTSPNGELVYNREVVQWISVICNGISYELLALSCIYKRYKLTNGTLHDIPPLCILDFIPCPTENTTDQYVGKPVFSRTFHREPR